MTTTHLSNIAPSPFNASRNNRTEQPASTEKPASAAPASPSAAENTFETVAGTATPLPAAAATTVTNSPLSVRLQGAAAVGDRPAETKIKRGVLLTSHGDIDNPATQLRDYVREAVLKNSGIPLPKFMQPKVKGKDLGIFTKQFSTMIDAGLPLVQALDILGKQQQNPTFKDALLEVKESVEGERVG